MSVLIPLLPSGIPDFTRNLTLLGDDFRKMLSLGV